MLIQVKNVHLSAQFLHLVDMHNCMIFSRFGWGESVLTDPVMSSGESV